MFNGFFPKCYLHINKCSFVQLLIPVVIPSVHWFLVEVNLKRWKVTVYDSMKGSFNDFNSNGRFEAFGRNLMRILDEIRYWEHLPKRRKRLQVMEFVEADVPQQNSSLGDCGVFLCMFMELLAWKDEDVAMEFPKDPEEGARNFRHRMASIFWGSV